MKEPLIAADSVKSTIAKIRAKKNAAQKTQSATAEITNQAERDCAVKTRTRRRVSHLTKPVSANERNEARLQIMRALISGEISQGEALKALRINVLGLKQDAFAKLVSVSRKTLSEVENDKGNYTSDIINKLFKPFGLKVGLVPVSQQVLSTLFFNKQ
jgi:DNA-binding XRE family transcriptional regulator